MNRLKDDVQDWLDSFEHALGQDSQTALTDLLCEDPHWRNILGIGWDFRTISGRDQVCGALMRSAQAADARNFATDCAQIPAQHAERADESVVECAIQFQSNRGRCKGVVRLRPDGQSGFRAWSLMTAIDEPSITADRQSPTELRDATRNWHEHRAVERGYRDRDPEVLVVGGGHAGLCAAVELGQRNVDALVIDGYERVGDNWRNRYSALHLHNRTPSNHLPYLPFPSTFPRYIPKDKIANWLEAYADIMELNVWTRTSLQQAQYDREQQCWIATLAQPDNSTRVIRPRHIVMATSISGSPKRAEIPGIQNFNGHVCHSGEFENSQRWRDQSAVVFGTGTSAHDISQDLERHGASVTMIQRSPTLIVNLEPSAQLYDQVYYDDGPPLAARDLMNSSFPLALVKRIQKKITDKTRELDAPLHARLDKAGFRLEFGENGTGWPLKYRTRGGGYYFNAGCSELIADGRIKLEQFSSVSHVERDGIRLHNQSLIDADLIVLATGYHSQDHMLEKLYGSAVAEKVGKVWGFDDDTQELNNMWTRTPQSGLWFTGGSFSQCRIYSRYLALQIEAELNSHA